MQIMISKGELDGIQKIISPDRKRLIHRKWVKGNDSTNQELQHTQNLDESIVPFERTDKAIYGNFANKSPDLSLQIHRSSHQFHDDLTTAVCSPGEGVHLNAISSKMDGPIIGDKNSDEQAVEKSKSDGDAIRGNYSMDEKVHLTNISTYLGEQHSQEEIQASLIGSTAKQQIVVEQLNCRNEAEHQRTYSQDHAGLNVVQTLAARLRQIHATQATTIELVIPRHTTKQGQPAIIYDTDDLMNKLTVDCKYTLIGKFSTTMPKIDLIRKSFILQTQLNRGGGFNISHYNARHVFIDLDNELDYNTVWTQQRMTIEGKLMRIQAWTPNFRPKEETPIIPIWVLLPGLPWHYFKKEFITPLLESVGKVLYLDTTSIKRTRASMAKGQYMNIPINEPPDKRNEKCQTKKGPDIDEYVVDNSEDDLDGDNHSLKDPDEEDETSELLIRDFSPYPDKGLEYEI
ncbi:hypothetical protein H5410_045686 [Solanum commersonii]|uniref:DUF4283 domain-containing protein n=1 Tax=Solanum commersonii TaxID=4109 RepID=A0A9J5XDG7_SOLCO|nr:hypothetical protein H5410_045686 [Solanum commersonii]